jgi:hypothetical protein
MTIVLFVFVGWLILMVAVIKLRPYIDRAIVRSESRYAAKRASRIFQEAKARMLAAAQRGQISERGWRDW